MGEDSASHTHPLPPATEPGAVSGDPPNLANSLANPHVTAVSSRTRGETMEVAFVMMCVLLIAALFIIAVSCD